LRFFFNPLTNKKEKLSDHLKTQDRQEGLSAYVRVKDESEFLRISLESHIDLVDEMVIVYNDCSDDSPDIINEFARVYSEKVKVYEYIPIVYPQGSKEFIRLAYDDVHSLVNYYNFALAMTTKKMAFKLDADQVAIKDNFVIAYAQFKQSLERGLSFRGCNLFDTADRTIHINGEVPLTSYDRGFIRVDTDIYHHKGMFCERLMKHTQYFPHSSNNTELILYYHIKSMKSDRGRSVWKLEENPDSVYHTRTRYYNKPTLLNLKKYILDNKDIFGDYEKISPVACGIFSKRKDKKIIGMGSGRCGTTSLTSILNKINITTHELILINKGNMDDPIAWENDFPKLKRKIGYISADISFWNLSYIEQLNNEYDCKFICLKRNKEDTVRSYSKWTQKQNVNHWVIHDNTKWNHNQWDISYPKFDYDDNKENSISKYWDMYYDLAERYERELDNFKIFDISSLNTEEGLQEILNFLDIELKDIKKITGFHDNKGEVEC